jgi:glycosyltransferase involved in cell wall biosynthesis
MIRILRVIGRMNVGGPAGCVLNLTAGLAGCGFESVLAVGAVGSGEGDLSSRVEGAGGTLRRIPGMRRDLSPFGDLRALLALSKIIRSYRPHIVHTHASKAGFLGRAAAFLVRGRRESAPPFPRVVHTFHGHVLDGYFGSLKSSFFREIEGRLAERTDVIIAVTDSVRRELLERHRVGRAGQYLIIPSGGQSLPSPAGRGGHVDLRGDLGLGPGPVVAVIGRLVPIKGHDLLLAALDRITAALPDIEVLLIGDGPLRVRIERFRARGRGGRSLVLLRNRDDVGSLLASSDILLLPSRKEGLPTVLIEAAFAGVPIVASRIPGVVDLVEDGESALLFPPDSPEALAGAVIAACRDAGLRERLAAGARRAVERVMTPDGVVAAHKRLYKKLYSESVGDVSCQG